MEDNMDREEQSQSRHISINPAQHELIVRTGVRAGEAVCTAEKISKTCFNWCCPTPAGGSSCETICYWDPDDW